MKDDGVHTAFEIILKEIGSVSKELKQEAKGLIDKSDFDAVQKLMDTGKRLDEFQVKMRSLQNEWINNFDVGTRSRTHFELVEIEIPPNDVIELVMEYGDAIARAEYSGRQVRILAGSTIRKVTYASLGDHILVMRNDAIKNGVLAQGAKKDLFEVKAPITFGSSSAGAQFVAGCSVSGPREWKVKNKGMSLKYWLSKK